MRKAALLLFLTLSTCLALAQDLRTFTITPPGEGGFSYVLQKGSGQGDPVAIETKSVEVAAPEDPNGYSIYVIDAAINRAAKADLVQVLKAKNFEPKSDQFTYIGEVIFNIKPKEGIVPAGTLTIQTGEQATVILVTASNNNRVSARFIPLTGRKFEFTYEADGSLHTETGTIPDDQSGGAATVDIGVDASFPSTAPDGKATDPTTDPKDAAQNPITSFFRLLVGLVVVGGLGYVAWYYYNNNQQVVQKLASQAGLTPQSDPDPTGALPPEPVKKDLQKIDLGSSAEPLAGTTAAATTTPIAKNPRLVNASGDIHLLPEGTQTVGRESANLTLNGESSVSRLHANIDRSANQITVTDAGSTNGTYINGTKIATPTVLNPGDTVQFGAISYRYEE